MVFWYREVQEGTWRYRVVQDNTNAVSEVTGAASEPKCEAGVRPVFRRVGLVGVGEASAAERCRGEVGRVHEPARGEHAVALHLREHRLEQDSADAASSMIDADRDHHHVAVFGKWAERVVLHALVRGHRDDRTVDLGDDHPPVEFGVVLVALPPNQSSDDLGDLDRKSVV